MRTLFIRRINYITTFDKGISIIKKPQCLIHCRSFTTKSNNNNRMTPEEAGRRAEEMAKQQQQLLSKSSSSSLSIDTILAHAGVGANEHNNAALSPPIHFATTYQRPANGPYHDTDSIYTRMDNPTRKLLEYEIAKLETYGINNNDNNNINVDNDVITCAFSSGMMAASSIIMTHTAPMDVILPIDLYHGVSTVLYDVFSTRFNVSVHRVDLKNSNALKEKINNIKENDNNNEQNRDLIVWIETPSNPLCHIIDIEETCKIVKELRQDATVVVDATIATPILCQPLKYGVDFVMHSGTKGIAGHSDALLGLVTASPYTTRGKLLGPILQQVQIAMGGVASTMDSWLTLRGLRTLSVRIQKQCQTALRIAQFLSNHPSVKNVYYPGLDNNKSDDNDKQYLIAKKQMNNNNGLYGCVLSIEMSTENRAIALAGALQTIIRATSLGGAETLIEHRASIEPIGRVTSPVGLLRISIGLEDVNDLVQDLINALDIVEQINP